ncbi:TfoX/Sxy family protein [Roseicyclus sp. F158]|uniref:TfoX/Sxy family protein n=1 Tax=Tropicimonas omnivorans TaxID=3075590 RepID=A0ABU3DGP0_9RHOB|nr:TfoX/Sxy family protein [Roseicyclus sp. F158]MDT0682886.1 TfoX/Sxy family protein [Roseicyclus sp. F158]
MAADPGLIALARDLFEALGEIRPRRMFGGAGLYIGDAMIAVVIDDVLYMKAGGDLSASYAEAGALPFAYDTKRGPRKIPGFMSLPGDALDDPEEALRWARLSLTAAEVAAAEREEKKARKTARGASSPPARRD